MKQLFKIKNSLTTLAFITLLSACGVDNGLDESVDANNSINDSVVSQDEGIITDDISADNSSEQEESNDSCLKRAYEDGSELLTCSACHVAGGLAGGTPLILDSADSSYNYEALKSYLAMGKGAYLLSKISAASVESHTGGKVSQDTLTYFEGVVDAYDNPNSCTNTSESSSEDNSTSDESSDDKSGSDSTDDNNTNSDNSSSGSSSSNLERGQELYTQQCTSCHGADGQGGSGAGPYFVEGSQNDTDAKIIDYVVATMPLTNTALCDSECAEDIHAYAKANFYNPNEGEAESEPACVDTEPSVSPQYIRLLSSKEYKATVADLLGFTSLATNDLPVDAVSGNFNNAASNMIVDANKMEAYLNVAINLAEESISLHKSNIISCEGSVAESSSSCALSSFTVGTTYATGESVQHNNRYFECLQGGWCTINSDAALLAYEPGVGYASSSAWKELTSCPQSEATTPTTNDSCALDFVREFGRLAYRRPLSETQENFYVNMIERAQSFDAGLKDVIASMLVSPHFLYRFEVGTNTGKGYAKLDAYETASALSYLLWGSMPDATLLDKAANGTLERVEGYDAEVTRMIQSSKAEKQMVDFTAQWLHTNEENLGEKPLKLIVYRV